MSQSPIGYAVYSEHQEKFLSQLKPSHWDIFASAALRFDTEQEARTVAARRKASCAVPVVLLRRADGEIEWETLKAVPSAPGGSWIVKSERDGVIFYLVRSAKGVCEISNSRGFAKGFKTRAGAARAAAVLPGAAFIEQVTADVVVFPGRT